MGVAGGPDMIENGLVLSLDASDRNSYVSGSTTWFDLSGNNNSGSLINGPTFNTGSLGSIVFDGVDDYVNLGINKLGPILNGTSGITLSTWIKPGSFSGGRTIISIIINGVLTLATIQFFDNALRVGGRSISTDSFQNTDYSYTTLNTWINFVGILNYTLDKLYIYLNGSLVQESNVTFNSTTLIHGTPTLNDSIANYGTTSNHMSGSIASTSIYNRALSAQEVLQNYNATKARFGL